MCDSNYFNSQVIKLKEDNEVSLQCSKKHNYPFKIALQLT